MTARLLPAPCWRLRPAFRDQQACRAHYASEQEARVVADRLVQDGVDELFTVITTGPGDTRMLDADTDRACRDWDQARRLVPMARSVPCCVVECDECGRPAGTDEAILHLAPADPWHPDAWDWTSDGNRDHCPDCPPLTSPNRLAVPGVGQLPLPVDLPCGGGPGGEGRC